MWPLIEFFVFKLTGVSAAAARALTLCVFGVTLLATWLLIERHTRPRSTTSGTPTRRRHCRSLSLHQPVPLRLRAHGHPRASPHLPHPASAPRRLVSSPTLLALQPAVRPLAPQPWPLPPPSHPRSRPSSPRDGPHQNHRHLSLPSDRLHGLGTRRLPRPFCTPPRHRPVRDDRHDLARLLRPLRPPALPRRLPLPLLRQRLHRHRARALRHRHPQNHH